MKKKPKFYPRGFSHLKDKEKQEANEGMKEIYVLKKSPLKHMYRSKKKSSV